MKQLIFFTESFPYGKGESFIENEIEFLALKYDKIYILPKTSSTPEKRELPANCETFSPIYSSPVLLLIKGVFCFAPLVYFIKKIFSERAYTSFYKFKKYIATVITCRAILSNKDFKYLNDLSVNNTVYFYWGIGIAYIMPFIKNKDKKIVRFHRTDLYLDRRPEPYIPFRKEVFENLTKAVFISKQGMEYAKKVFSQYYFKAYCSYLGTKDHGVSSILSHDSTIHIISCSNVVPVKRVPLILNALLLISNYTIHWTHLGGGKDFDDLKRSIHDLPNNLTINLRGPIKNQEVIQFYLQNPIDLFVNVSSSEGLPVSIMEAISFNIPVIATNVGGTNEIVTPETGILLDPNFSSQELANYIIEMYQNKCKYHPRRLWEEKFNASKNYNQFIEQILE